MSKTETTPTPCKEGYICIRSDKLFGLVLLAALGLASIVARIISNVP